VLIEDRVLRLRVLDSLEDAGVPAVWAADTRETVWAFDLHRPSLLVVDAAALEKAADRVSAICRTAAASRACVLVAREVPRVAEALVADGVLELIRPDALHELARRASVSP
jgi:DNA-binding response OmpR family regulator